MPEPDSGPQRQPWWGPPNDELPVTVGTPEILWSSDHVAIGFAGVRLYRDGVEILLERRLRRRGGSHTRWQELTAVFYEHGFHGGSGRSRLRYGIQFDDGARATDSPFPPMTDPNTPPDGPSLLRTGGGGGSDNSFATSSDGLWLYPRPTKASMQLVIQWSAFDIPETRTTLKVGGMAGLVEGSLPFWR